MDKIRKVLYKEGRYLYWRSGDLHTNYGMVKEAAMKKANKEVKTNKGEKLIVLEPSYNDLIRKIKRDPQTLLPKDLAAILFYTGINKKYKILDAGAGCGLLAASMARIAKEVTTYEKNPGYQKMIEHNLSFLGIKNVNLKIKDIYDGIEEKDLDLITLDLPEPWKVLKHATKALKQSGYLMTYLPTIVQVIQLVEESEKQGFIHLKTIELLEREWHVEGKRVRPKSQMIGHSAFLTFLRKP